MDNLTLILLLSPLILIQLGLTIYSLIDFFKRDPSQIRGDNRWVWLVIILLGSTIGSIAYLTLGRKED